MARGVRCQAHRHTSVVAEENHHLQPMSRGGRTVAANMRYLCANAHSDTHYLLDLIEDGAIPLIGTGASTDDAINTIPWSVARTYGPGVRDAAFDGWARYGDAFLVGEYRRHAALWTSSGQPRPDAERRLGFWPSMMGTSVLRVPYSQAAAAWGFGEFDTAVREAKPLR